jgi:hypothetical protein
MLHAPKTEDEESISRKNNMGPITLYTCPSMIYVCARREGAHYRSLTDGVKSQKASRRQPIVRVQISNLCNYKSQNT